MRPCAHDSSHSVSKANSCSSCSPSPAVNCTHDAAWAADTSNLDQPSIEINGTKQYIGFLGVAAEVKGCCASDAFLAGLAKAYAYWMGSGEGWSPYFAACDLTVTDHLLPLAKLMCQSEQAAVDQLKAAAAATPGATCPAGFADAYIKVGWSSCSSRSVLSCTCRAVGAVKGKVVKVHANAVFDRPAWFPASACTAHRCMQVSAGCRYAFASAFPTSKAIFDACRVSYAKSGGQRRAGGWAGQGQGG